MVDISPLRGLIYNEEKFQDISDKVSPPYDVISENDRNNFLSGHENISNLILPHGDGDQKYKNASGLLKEWMDKKILVQDNQESYYILKIDFELNGRKKNIAGFIGLTRVEPYASGKVLRHEKTLSGPKKDRYSLLQACRTNFGLIYTIYRDDKKEIDSIIRPYLQDKPFRDFSPDYDSALSFKAWKISDKKNIDMITELMKNRSILIADGHHRYETSLMYKNETNINSNGSGPQDYVLTLFMESGQEDIKIYPTYRSVKFNDFSDISKYFDLAKNKYTIKPVNTNTSESIKTALDRFRTDNTIGFIFYLKDSIYSIALNSRPSDNKSKMDIYILHNDILKELDRLYNIANISFSHDGSSIISDVKKDISDIGIFLNPPTVKEMEDICNSGGLMPQKSTFFWPKPCTGLVMYKF